MKQQLNSIKSKKRVVVLGHNGMLGHVVSTVLSEEFTVFRMSQRFSLTNPESFFTEISNIHPNAVINCIGSIPQRTVNPAELLATNSYFPMILRRNINPSTLIIHPSSDCVFDGNNGPYKIDVLSSAAEPYGISKSLGEQIRTYPGSVVIRTSIIGPDPVGRSTGLFSWLLSQPQNHTVNGYTNHFWNGITTLQWARIARDIIQNFNLVQAGTLIQVGTTEHNSKYTLLKHIAARFRPDLKIEEFEAEKTVNRVLIPEFVAPDIETQLDLLKVFMLSAPEPTADGL